MIKSRIRLFGRGEEGQAMAAVLGLTAVFALLIVSVQLSSVGQARLATLTNNAEKALEAAQAGINDYQTWLGASTNGWTYAGQYCSNGITTWPITTGYVSTQCPVSTDPKNPAYSALLDPKCSSSSSTATAGTVGTSNYYGWELVSGKTAVGVQNEEYQYVVDSRSANASPGFVHVFVVGRAGSSGHYTCRTLKMAINSPLSQGLTNPPTLISPTSASCSGQTVPVPAAPSGTAPAFVQITATGGSGEAGGNGGLTFGGGQGGTGQTVTATYPYAGSSALGSSTLYVNIGCQGGSTSGITQAGAGFNSGGALPATADAGGGGGSTAVCVNITPCIDTNLTLDSVSGIDNNVLMIAGGGGGGGEAVFLAGAGTGGNGGNTGGTPYTPGSSGSGGAFSSGGNGGSGNAYSCTLNAGHTAVTSCTGDGHSGNAGFGDGAGGGGGFNGGGGGTAGWSGGGGGGASSFLSGKTGDGGTGFGVSTFSFNPASSPTYGSVTIQWFDSSHRAISTPFSPSPCGTSNQASTLLGPSSVISVTMAGGGGGSSDDNNLLGFLTGGFGTGAPGGSGSAITASYTVGSSPVWVTSVQGCAGVIGNEDGGDPGGNGLGNGGYNVPAGSGSGNGASGSGGGGSALCFGTTQAASVCSTTSASNVLLVAGGGGGASEEDTCQGGNDGGNAGIGTGSGTTSVSTGIVKGSTPTGGNGGKGGNNGSGTGAGGAATTYSPNATNGQLASGPDSGGGGGGYDGGAGGTGGSDGILCLFSSAGGAGGGGSSYVNATASGLTLTKTTSSTAVTLGSCTISATGITELCWSSNAPGNLGTVTVTETSVQEPAGVVYEGPGQGGSTAW